MKRTPMMVAALLPIAAIASQEAGLQELDAEQLKNHVQATRVLGAEVQSGDGMDVGTVEDIIFDQQGNISSVLVQREGSRMSSRDRDGWSEETREAGDEMADAAENAAAEVESGAENAARETESAWDEATADDEGAEDMEAADVRAKTRERTDREGNGMSMTADLDRADTMEVSDEFAQLKWSDVNYNAEDEVLRVSADALSGMQAVQYDQSSAQTLQGTVRASKLVGLEVNLADEESFGEIEDVMIDPVSGKASALVVDSMKFFDKERYALPVALQGLDRDAESLTLQVTQQQVEDMGEFQMDEARSTR